uniref:Uncharacterized protein n=1 Tax=Timema bartmani TaxID=61472 RepID=A0A7R9HWP1_9NEOP|nr:unnamed protein product [Timema bartmani]
MQHKRTTHSVPPNRDSKPNLPVTGGLVIYCESNTPIERNSMVSVRKRTIPTKRLPLLAMIVPTFKDRGCHVDLPVIETGSTPQSLFHKDRVANL